VSVNLTRAQFDVLDFARHMQRCHGKGTGMLTGRLLRRSVAESCADKGWLERRSLRVIDGDGWTKEPERFRPGYVLTASGRQALEQAEAAE
jgi:hypothetical protein